MKRVTGIGGVFVRSPDPARLAAWYATHLGVEPNPAPDDGCATLQFADDPTGSTTWATFADDTDYFGPEPGQVMINYRVAELDALLAALRDEGVRVEDKVERTEFGEFGWGYDCDGNRFELWQPPPGA